MSLFHLLSERRSGIRGRKGVCERGRRVRDDKGASEERLKSNPFKIGLGKLDSGNETVEGGREDNGGNSETHHIGQTLSRNGLIYPGKNRACMFL